MNKKLLIAIGITLLLIVGGIAYVLLVIGKDKEHPDTVKDESISSQVTDG